VKLILQPTEPASRLREVETYFPDENLYIVKWGDTYRIYAVSLNSPVHTGKGGQGEMQGMTLIHMVRQTKKGTDYRRNGYLWTTLESLTEDDATIGAQIDLMLTESTCPLPEPLPETLPTKDHRMIETNHSSWCDSCGWTKRRVHMGLCTMCSPDSCVHSAACVHTTQSEDQYYQNAARIIQNSQWGTAKPYDYVRDVCTQEDHHTLHFDMRIGDLGMTFCEYYRTVAPAPYVTK